jgi:hypothetical protein
MSKLPNFIIIGAMKCATSTLHEQLALQPGIFMSEPKEPNFFSNDSEYNQGMDWYSSLFAEATPEDICGESSTHYTKLPTYPETVARIEQHLGKVKFIYIMRHPIDRLVSQYIHEWSEGVVSVEINQAIAQLPQLIEYSLYTQQLQPYFDTFGREQVLPVFFERLLAEPQAELERVCQFIGYPQQPVWDFNLEAQNVSQQRIRRSAWRDFLVEAPLLKPLRRNLIPKTWRTWVRSWWSMKEKPQLNPEQRQHLENIFNPDLAELGNWLGINLTCDNFKTQVKQTTSPRFQ